jgi:hypothetical protein
MIRNAKTLPQVFYGLHMVEGVAEYAEPEKEPYRILVGESAIKNMDPTFQGKPVYLDHVDEVDLDNLQEEADGYVLDSFYNKLDGKHWVKFIVVSDRAKDAIKRGWKLSNAYIPKSFVNGGLWHGVEYSKEVTSGEYEHLAIVKNPRYEESLVLTPDEFKKYNADKEQELSHLTNSKTKKEKTAMGLPKLNIFKRTKVENSTDLDGLMIELPKSKIDMPLTQIVNELDAIKNMNGYANGDHMVKVGEDEMSVNDLVKKHLDMRNEMEKLKASKESEATEVAEDEVGDRGGDKSLENEDPGGDPSVDNEEDEEAKKKALEVAKNEEKEAAEEKKKNELSEAARKKSEAAKKAAALKNAHLRDPDEEAATVELMEDQIARGRARYGS